MPITKRSMLDTHQLARNRRHRRAKSDWWVCSIPLHPANVQLPAAGLPGAEASLAPFLRLWLWADDCSPYHACERAAAAHTQLRSPLKNNTPAIAEVLWGGGGGD
jgi:hypothetical protein